jgi:hypothetical protein
MPAKIILFFGTTHPKRYRAIIIILTPMTMVTLPVMIAMEIITQHIVMILETQQ